MSNLFRRWRAARQTRRAYPVPPDWMRGPTRALPTVPPGYPGRLTPGRQWRANGGRW
ncbi:hypothetical protein [Micromonospora sp. SH-82]|uniref:hypothetical protein n=1 Tax=Micromonospora sp. SH-82 TaxID=3132938 RepID=UPI003EBFFCAD